MSDQQRSSHASAGSEKGAARFELQTVFIALRCWWKIALPLGLLAAAGAGSLVYYLFQPTYTASAWIYIGERARQIVPAHSEDSQRFVANQNELMLSPYLLTPVANQKDIVDTPEIADKSDRYQALRSKLKINNQGQSEYYSIEFSSLSPEKAALIVNSIADAYISLQRSNQNEQRQRIVEVLDGVLKEYASRVRDVKRRLDDAAKTKGVEPNDPLLNNQRGVPDSEEATLATLQAELIKIEVDHAMIEAAGKSLEKSLQGDRLEVPAAELETAIQSDPALQRLSAELEKIKSSIEGHRRTGTESLLARDPRFQGLLKQEKELKEKLQKETEQARSELTERFAAALENQRKADLEAAKDRLTGVTLMRDELRAKVAEALKNRKEARGDLVQLHFDMGEYDFLNGIYAKCSQEIENIKANGQLAGDRVYQLQPADIPRNPDEVVPYKRIGMFAGAAFCLPFLLAVAWEHFFRRVNSRQQLEMIGALKVVGEITELPRRTRRSGTARISRDLQLFEESVDGLRTYLSLLDSLEGLRVLAVTSAISREGKTSVAAQLAVSLAAATGEPTLLIDGDLRSPDIHRVFGVDLSPGLSDVLAGDLTDEDAIETDFNQTLHLMTAGRLSTSPHRLLGGGEFRTLLARLRGVYRYIVIDTPPLLPASEALILARAADAAILSARRDYSRLDQVTEAYTRLRSAGVAFAGVVLNGIPVRHYAYKYGSYGYRRQLGTRE
jgi:capsular exopolysaccharide synthesis family protein